MADACACATSGVLACAMADAAACDRASSLVSPDAALGKPSHCFATSFHFLILSLNPVCKTVPYLPHLLIPQIVM